MPVSALKSADFPTFGSPTMPISMIRGSFRVDIDAESRHGSRLSEELEAARKKVPGICGTLRSFGSFHSG